MGFIVEDAHIDHVHQFQQVVGDLSGVFRSRVHANCHARDMRFVGAADREAVDIKGAPAEHAGNAVQDARLILHQGDNGHLRANCLLRHHASPGFGLRFMSCKSAPAGTIG